MTELRRWKSGKFSKAGIVGEIYEVRPNVFKVTGKEFRLNWELEFTPEHYEKWWNEVLKERSGVTCFEDAVEAEIWECVALSDLTGQGE